MPDVAICNSTVCPVRRNCQVNWSSGVYKPDRDPKQQAWISDGYPRKDPRSHDAFCDFYQPVDFEMAWKDERQARQAIEQAVSETKDQIGRQLCGLLGHFDAPHRARSDCRSMQFERASD